MAPVTQSVSGEGAESGDEEGGDGSDGGYSAEGDDDGDGGYGAKGDDNGDDNDDASRFQEIA